MYRCVKLIGLSGVQFGLKFITSVITDRIEWQEVLLPINHKIKNSEKRRIANWVMKEGEIYIERLTEEAIKTKAVIGWFKL